MNSIEDLIEKPVYLVVVGGYVHRKFNGDYLYRQKAAADKRAWKVNGVVHEFTLERAEDES